MTHRIKPPPFSTWAVAGVALAAMFVATLLLVLFRRALFFADSLGSRLAIVAGVCACVIVGMNVALPLETKTLTLWRVVGQALLLLCGVPCAGIALILSAPHGLADPPRWLLVVPALAAGAAAGALILSRPGAPGP